jgi:hypothetical protein
MKLPFFSTTLLLTALAVNLLSNGLEGNWQLCITGTGSPAESCAAIHVDSFVPTPWPDRFGNRSSTFRFSIDLNAVLSYPKARVGEFGTLITDDSLSRVAVRLGSRDGKTYIGDGGWLLAVLRRTPDSLYGTYSRTCRGGCPERGRVIFRRIR